MKKLLSVFLIALCGSAFSQTTPLTVTTIPKAQPDFVYTPGRGPEVWNWQNQVNVPNAATNTNPAQLYIRYCWYQLQSGSAASAGASMNFTQLDQDFQTAIAAGQTVRIGFLLDFGDQAPNTVGGSLVVYPLALHNLMQSETVKDFNDGSYWDANVNSSFWLQWFTALANNTANHINTTSFNGVPYSSVLKAVDLRINGDFGEGAVNQGEPFGTATALNAMVDAYKTAFPNVFLEAMIGNFSGGIPGPTGIGITPLATSSYILSTSNNKGKFGVRRDNWGNNATYVRNWTDLNPNVDGFRYDTSIQNRWMYAPVTGEPENSGVDMSDLLAEVDRLHATRIGNGNYGNTSTTLSNNMRAAYLEMGYRWQINSGTSTTTFLNGASNNVTLILQNVGISPTYDHWTEFFELKDISGTVVASWTGTFDPYLIVPGTYTNSTSFNLTGIPTASNYSLYVTFKDALSYMKPMPLANTNVQSNGSYLIRSNVAVSNGTAPPVANAGNAQTITLPTSSTGLSGSASTGTITSYAWSQVSGPNTATLTTPTQVTTMATGLIAGTYVFQLSLNSGASIATVSVTVNPAPPPPPVANAGTNQTITLPTSSVTLNGTGSTGTITSYLWSLVSGPNTPTIVSPVNVTATASGLIAGTYIFRLSLNGGVSTSQVTFTVNPAAGGGGGGTSNTVFTTQTPTTGTVNDGTAVELGMKFTSNANGYITGVRFYKTSGNTGTHTGELYTIAGVRLAQAVFTGETATGWQTVTFATPVAITAGTVYVAAYLSGSGNYVYTPGGFLTAVVNSPLTGLADGTSGHNGVYLYTATPAFPNQYSSANNQPNYWVDATYSPTIPQPARITHTHVGGLIRFHR